MKVVKALVRLGADVAIQDRLGDTAWDKADMAGFNEVKDFLRKVEEGEKCSLRSVNYSYTHMLHPSAVQSKTM